MSNAATALAVVRGLNIALGMARELQVSYGEVARLIKKAEDEGRDVTIDDLATLRADSQEALDRLNQTIREAAGGAD